jgi:hypothetical protein
MSTDRLDRIELILETLTGRLDMLTAQVARTALTIDRLALQVDRLVEGTVRGFTSAAERDAQIERRLAQLEALTQAPSEP